MPPHSITYDATNMMTAVFAQNRGTAQYTYNGFKQLDSLSWLTSHILDEISTIDTIECHWGTYFGPWIHDVLYDLRRMLR